MRGKEEKNQPQDPFFSYSLFFWGKLFATWLCGNKGVIPSFAKNHQLVWRDFVQIGILYLIKKAQENHLTQHLIWEKIHTLTSSPSTKHTGQGWDVQEARKPDKTSCQNSPASQRLQRLHKSTSFTTQFRNLSTPIGNSDNFQPVLIHSSAQMWKEIWRKVPGERKKAVSSTWKALSVRGNSAKRKQFSSWHWTSLL